MLHFVPEYTGYAYDFDWGYPRVFCLAIQLIMHTFRHLKKIVSI